MSFDFINWYYVLKIQSPVNSTKLYDYWILDIIFLMDMITLNSFPTLDFVHFVLFDLNILNNCIFYHL